MNFILSFLKSFMQPVHNPGVLPDNRPLAEKENDVHQEEFVAGIAVTWTEKPQSEWMKFPERFQNGSMSCVFQSNAKGRGITEASKTGNFPILSARRYNERSNFPNGGTIPYEGLQWVTRGFPLEFLYPSQNMHEAEMDTKIPKSPQVIDSQIQFQGGIPVVLPIDIDAIAGVIDQGYGVVLCFRFPQSEWTYIPSYNGGYASIGHQVVSGVRTLHKGQKALIVEDSWLNETAKNGQRIITEDYLLKRCFFAGYVKMPQPLTTQPKPKHIFTTDLWFGMRGNEVLNLQQRLISEGLLAADCATSYFGALTKQAVTTYQKKNHLPTTGYVGILTRTSLNQS